MFYFILGFLGSFIDLFFKNKISNPKEPCKNKYICNKKIRIKFVPNYGLILNALDFNSNIASKLSLCCYIILLIVYIPLIIFIRGMHIVKLILTFIVCGATSNSYDRIKKGFVVDYINFPTIKPIKHIFFNIGDFFIFIGSLFLAVWSLIKWK